MAEGLDWPWPNGPAGCLKAEGRGAERLLVVGGGGGDEMEEGSL